MTLEWAYEAMRQKYENEPGELAAAIASLDRLILEVQAEMPCYHITDGPKRSCKAYRQGAGMGGLCPSCTARMKLKETADEPLPGTPVD